MKSVLRKVGITLAAAAVSVGLLAISAPAADADTSWGTRSQPSGTP
jgi:hypothetical protein